VMGDEGKAQKCECVARNAEHSINAERGMLRDITNPTNGTNPTNEGERRSLSAAQYAVLVTFGAFVSFVIGQSLASMVGLTER